MYKTPGVPVENFYYLRGSNTAKDPFVEHLLRDCEWASTFALPFDHRL